MQKAALLYVSDDPETFSDHGRLSHGPLPADGSVAPVLFDHVNGMERPMRPIVGIFNLGAGPHVVNLRRDLVHVRGLNSPCPPPNACTINPYCRTEAQHNGGSYL